LFPPLGHTVKEESLVIDHLRSQAVIVLHGALALRCHLGLRFEGGT
jgi:hypothetical protein